MTAQKTIEIYVRFVSETHGPGMFESPCHSIDEAAGQFVEDRDSVSATRMTFGADGALVSAEDVTEAVMDQLREMITADTWTRCPHPALEEDFRAWQEEAERAAEEQREHERIESAMIHI